MAVDQAIADGAAGELLMGARHDAALNGVLDRNLVQMGGVVNTTLVQQHGGVADDSSVMAALRTAVHVPVKTS